MRVPVEVRLQRGSERDATWSAERATTASWLQVHGAASEAEVKLGMVELINQALSRADQLPIMVIGGAADYATTIHLIVPEPHGYMVLVVRDGKYAAMWSPMPDSTIDETLTYVLKHVGGDPTVLRF